MKSRLRMTCSYPQWGEFSTTSGMVGTAFPCHFRSQPKLGLTGIYVGTVTENVDPRREPLRRLRL